MPPDLRRPRPHLGEDARSNAKVESPLEGRPTDPVWRLSVKRDVPTRCNWPAGGSGRTTSAWRERHDPDLSCAGRDAGDALLARGGGRRQPGSSASTPRQATGRRHAIHRHSFPPPSFVTRPLGWPVLPYSRYAQILVQAAAGAGQRPDRTAMRSASDARPWTRTRPSEGTGSLMSAWDAKGLEPAWLSVVAGPVGMDQLLLIRGSRNHPLARDHLPLVDQDPD